jgi:hypothetical protein
MQKNNDQPESYGVSFMVNGSANFTFTKNDSGQINQNPPQSSYFAWQTWQSDSLNSAYISLFVIDSNSITPGIYDNDEPSNAISPFKISMSYTDATGQSFFLPII